LGDDPQAPSERWQFVLVEPSHVTIINEDLAALRAQLMGKQLQDEALARRRRPHKKD
jgi:hypothetical protein